MHYTLCTSIPVSSLPAPISFSNRSVSSNQIGLLSINLPGVTDPDRIHADFTVLSAFPNSAIPKNDLMLSRVHCYVCCLSDSGWFMRFKVSISKGVLTTLPRMLQQKLARRAARKVLRMGQTSATVIFRGPDDLQVIVNCVQATILIAKAHETLRGSLLRDQRQAA